MTILASCTLPPDSWNILPQDVRDILRDRFHTAIPIRSLRERKREMGKWTKALLSRYAGDFGAAEKTFSPKALRIFRQYHWPGNFPEFRIAVGRALTASESPSIKESDARSALRRRIICHKLWVKKPGNFREFTFRQPWGC